MTYKDFVIKEFKENNWISAAESFKEIKGRKVLIFTHDDPDGLSSGCILKRLVRMMGGRAQVKLPATYELAESQLNDELKKDNYYMVIVSDKGTMGYYDKYVDKVEKFLVIDHHPPIGEIKKCLLINPNTIFYKMCSASYLAHMLMTYLGKGEKYDDFLALVGLKGDWAVEPATDIVSEYVSAFYKEKVEEPFKSLIKKIDSHPTMFEVNQREKTTLLSQITELYFALGGGGFQYFYNDRHDELKDINQSEFSFLVMEKYCERFDWKNLHDFIDNTIDRYRVNLIYEYFRKDWGKTIKSFSSVTLLTTLGTTDVYLFLGYRVLLMPMAGSVYLNKLKEESGNKEVLFIMVNRESDGGIHFSIRGTDDYIHAGKICSDLAKRLVEKYNNKEQITGGGHYRAAECRTRKSGVTLAESLEVFSKLIMDMEKAATFKEC